MENEKVAEMPVTVTSYEFTAKEREIVLQICDIAIKSVGLRGATDILSIVAKFSK